MLIGIEIRSEEWSCEAGKPTSGVGCIVTESQTVAVRAQEKPEPEKPETKNPHLII